MKGSDQVKRIPVIFLRYIVFFIPAIILSVLVWNHYQDDLSTGKVTEYDVKRMFTFDEGKRVVSAVSKTSSSILQCMILNQEKESVNGPRKAIRLMKCCHLFKGTISYLL